MSRPTNSVLRPTPSRPYARRPPDGRVSRPASSSASGSATSSPTRSASSCWTTNASATTSAGPSSTPPFELAVVRVDIRPEVPPVRLEGGGGEGRRSGGLLDADADGGAFDELAHGALDGAEAGSLGADQQGRVVGRDGDEQAVAGAAERDGLDAGARWGMAFDDLTDGCF